MTILMAALVPAAGLAVLLAAASAPLLVLPAALLVLRAGVDSGTADAVRGSERDLDLVQLVPLGIGPIPFGNRPQLLQAALRRRLLRLLRLFRLWRLLRLFRIVHAHIVV